MFISHKALCLAREKGFVLRRSTRARLRSSERSPSMLEGACLCSAPKLMHPLTKKRKAKRRNSCRCHYHRANKNDATKTLIFGVAAAESPATHWSRASHPRHCLPSGSSTSSSPLAAEQHQQPKPQAGGEQRITRTIGYYESKLPHQPSLRPRAATPQPAPASTRTGRPRHSERAEAKAFPSRSRLRNYPCIHPEASALVLFLGFSTFPPRSATSVLRERHRVTHFTH